MVDDFVVLVNDRGDPIGEQRKSLVHNGSTPLHLAFSLYLMDSAGRVLVTRRALSKLTWPGVWTNTCCGHPRRGETLTEAIDRRLEAELGMQVTNLRSVLPDFAYRARDASGVWENEICPVFVGTAVDRELHVRPDPDEVVEWAWVEWGDMVAAMSAAPFAFSPWAVLQVAQLSS
jgi:isopentenyl-diphosphate delta-isomerase type 1